MAAAVVGIALGYAYQLLLAIWTRWRKIWQMALLLAVMALMVKDLNFYFFEVYDFYVLGGTNTEVATAVARYLENQPEPPPFVYFHGPPRMGFRTHSTVPYLVPHIHGTDVLEPLTAPPDWAFPRPAIFIFLPERQNEYPLVVQAYPGGRYREIQNGRGQILFSAYEVR
jgi:hypothetical protein